MVSASTALLAFCVGIGGAIVGGTQVFIMTGFAGICVYLLKAAGVESPFLTDTLLNTVFLPAIIFNAATVSTAFAARRHDIEGWDVNHSLIFTHDPVVMLISGLGGVIGYIVFVFAQWIGLPADQGSFSVILVGVVTRLLLGHGHWLNPKATAYYRQQGPKYWVFQAINAVGVCGLTAIALSYVPAEYYTVAFNISAALILLSGFDQQRRTYPTTHHETLIVAYAMAATGANVVVSMLFVMLSNLVYLLFARYCNENCDTHIDPPAVAIEVCSLILFTLF